MQKKSQRERIISRGDRGVPVKWAYLVQGLWQSKRARRDFWRAIIKQKYHPSFICSYNLSFHSLDRLFHLKFKRDALPSEHLCVPHPTDRLQNERLVPPDKCNSEWHLMTQSGFILLERTGRESPRQRTWDAIHLMKQQWQHHPWIGYEESEFVTSIRCELSAFISSAAIRVGLHSVAEGLLPKAM